MVQFNRTRVSLRVALGCCCLLACLGGAYLGLPAYETSIDAQAPTEEAMAASLDAYSPSEIEPIEFEALSPEEQAAVRGGGAVGSADRIYSDRGPSDEGTRFAYRNDVTNHYFVEYEGSIYLVRVVVDIGYLLLAGSLAGGGVGALLVVSGLWRRRSG
ncbi:hypothetical protein Z052_15180 [Halorubrum sp. C191]|nr:hypothetical protein Z052_15180 [Halorubrum sp. C191]